MTCKGGQSHTWAERLATWLVAHGGSVDAPNWTLIKDSGLTPGQFVRARHHLMDAEDAHGNPCLGFRVNYKWSALSSTLSLIDPLDTFNNLRDVAQAMTRGARQQYVSQLTVQHRLSNQYLAMAQAWDKTCLVCKGSSCRLGRVYEQAAEEWVRLGHITSTTAGRIAGQQTKHGVPVVAWPS